jgi:hypothetical protein
MAVYKRRALASVRGCNIAFSKSRAHIILSKPARPQDIAHHGSHGTRQTRTRGCAPRRPAPGSYEIRRERGGPSRVRVLAGARVHRRAGRASQSTAPSADATCAHITYDAGDPRAYNTNEEAPGTHTSAPACGELRGICAQSCCKLESRLAPRRAAARRSRCATVAAARGPAITAAAIVPAAAEAASSATPPLPPPLLSAAAPAAAEVAPDATGPQPSPTAVEASPLRPQVPEARRERGGSERRRTAVRGVFEASTPGAWLPARRPEKRTCGGGKGGTQRGPPHAALGIVRMAYTSRERAAGRHGKQGWAPSSTRARAAAVLLSAAEACYAPRAKKCISSSSPEWS